MELGSLSTKIISDVGSLLIVGTFKKEKAQVVELREVLLTPLVGTLPWSPHQPQLTARKRESFVFTLLSPGDESLVTSYHCPECPEDPSEMGLSLGWMI